MDDDDGDGDKDGLMTQDDNITEMAEFERVLGSELKLSNE